MKLDRALWAESANFARTAAELWPDETGVLTGWSVRWRAALVHAAQVELPDEWFTEVNGFMRQLDGMTEKATQVEHYVTAEESVLVWRGVLLIACTAFTSVSDAIEPEVRALCLGEVARLRVELTNRIRSARDARAFAKARAR